MMKLLTPNQEGALHEPEVKDLISNSRDVWPVCGAGIGLIGCALTPLLGALLTLVAWIKGNSGAGPFLHKVGTVLFLLTIPLLIFGGYCLDVLEKRGYKFE